jgi:hypothetical protein
MEARIGCMAGDSGAVLVIGLIVSCCVHLRLNLARGFWPRNKFDFPLTGTPLLSSRYHGIAASEKRRSTLVIAGREWFREITIGTTPIRVETRCTKGLVPLSGDGGDFRMHYVH